MGQVQVLKWMQDIDHLGKCKPDVHTIVEGHIKANDGDGALQL